MRMKLIGSRMKKILFVLICICGLLVSCQDDNVIASRVPNPNKGLFSVVGGKDTIRMTDGSDFSIQAITFFDRTSSEKLGNIFKLGTEDAILVNKKEVVTVKRTNGVIDAIDVPGFCMISKIESFGKIKNAYEIKPYSDASLSPYYLSISVIQDELGAAVVVR